MAYERIETLKESEKSKVYLVLDSKSGLMLVEKHLTGHLPVYEKLQSLQHPYLPQIYEVELQDDCTIVREEYIAGGALATICAGEMQVRYWMLELCWVLDFLHYHGVLHRDIKPSNLLLGEDGHIRLIDFDAAREGKPEAEADTRLLGTRGYAPPEQYGFAQTDQRADIYAVGITLQSLLGEKAKKREYKIIIARCTQFTPERRYASAAHLATAIRRRKVRSARPLLLCGLAFLLAIAAFFLFPEVEERGKASGAKPPMEEDTASFFSDQLLGEWFASRWDAYTGITTEFDGFALTISKTESGAYYGKLFFSHETVTQDRDEALVPVALNEDTMRFYFNGHGSAGMMEELNGYLDLTLDITGQPKAALTVEGSPVAQMMPLLRIEDWLGGKYMHFDRENSHTYMFNSTDTLHPLEMEWAYQEVIAGRWMGEHTSIDFYEADLRITWGEVSHFRMGGVNFDFFYPSEPNVIYEVRTEGSLLDGYMENDPEISINGVPYKYLN